MTNTVAKARAAREQAREQPRLTPAERDEFRAETLAENVARLGAIALVGTLVNAVVIAVGFATGDGFSAETWLRVAWMAASLAYLLVAVGPGRRPKALKRAALLSAASLSLLFSALITGLLPAEQGSTFLFIINMLLTGAFLCLSLPQLALVAGPALAYLVFAMSYFEGRLISLTANALNIFAVSAFALLVSWVSYRSRLERFRMGLALRANNEALRSLADRDGLTGIPNRRKVDESLAALWALSERHAMQFSVLMADIDDFKAYNDTRGHLEGDALLRSVAAAMGGCLERAGDFFGRYGGEEFIAILPGTDAEGAARVAERMRAAVEALGIPHGGGGRSVVTVSIGVAGAHAGLADCGEAAAEKPSGCDPLEVLRNADLALYEAKREGKNAVRRA